MNWWRSERSRNGGVDEVPLSATTGRLWLCGKHFVGPDAEQALTRVGGDTVVCLNEAGELESRYPDYVRWLRDNVPVRAVWFPIPDLHVPAADEVAPLLDDLERRLGAGRGLLLHCGAGVGRAGTIATALLMRLGVPMTEALAVVGASRPSAGPQSAEQFELLTALDVSG